MKTLFKTLIFVAITLSMSIAAAQTIEYAGGIVYEGDVVNGKMNGQGTLTEPLDASGMSAVTTGHFVDNAIDGYATMIAHMGNITITYAGNWVKDQMSGHGKMTTVKPGLTEIIEGNWASNEMNGYGTQTLIRHGVVNSVYEGNFVNSVKHGQGTETIGVGDGRIVRGTWINGQYQWRR
jgi:hypothetical protein